MTEQLKEIGQRLRALREIMDISLDEMARQCQMPLEEYQDYESGKRDFSFSFLYNAANILQVDVVDLMSGDSPKLSTCTLVRGGQGYSIERRAAYKYVHLAFTFCKKKAEPFLVTVEPGETMPVLHSHEGQEFEYLLKGNVRFALGEHEYEMQAGDSVYFDSNLPHAIQAIGETAQFIAVVMK